MAPKKKQSLAVSRKKIEEERINVDIRTTARIEKLYAAEGRSSEFGVSAKKMAWPFEYVMLLSYPLVHNPTILLLALPKQ
jgi:hypothetical protein